MSHEVNGHATSPDTSRGSGIPRYLVERLLLDTTGYLEHSDLIIAKSNGHVSSSELQNQLQMARARLATAGYPVPAVEAMVRYDWAARQLDGVIGRPTERSKTVSDTIDRILTNRLWGTVVFAAMMVLLFSSIFIFAKPLMYWIQTGVDFVSSTVKGQHGGWCATVAVGRWHSRRRRQCDRISAANPHLVHVHRDSGRLRLHGPGCLLDGQANGSRGFKRQIVHSVAFVVCLRHSGHHGDSGD